MNDIIKSYNSYKSYETNCMSCLNKKKLNEWMNVYLCTCMYYCYVFVKENSDCINEYFTLNKFYELPKPDDEIANQFSTKSDHDLAYPMKTRILRLRKHPISYDWFSIIIEPFKQIDLSTTSLRSKSV